MVADVAVVVVPEVTVSVVVSVTVVVVPVSNTVVGISTVVTTVLVVPGRTVVIVRLTVCVTTCAGSLTVVAGTEMTLPFLSTTVCAGTRTSVRWFTVITFPLTWIVWVAAAAEPDQEPMGVGARPADGGRRRKDGHAGCRRGCGRFGRVRGCRSGSDGRGLAAFHRGCGRGCARSRPGCGDRSFLVALARERQPQQEPQDDEQQYAVRHQDGDGQQDLCEHSHSNLPVVVTREPYPKPRRR